MAPENATANGAHRIPKAYDALERLERSEHASIKLPSPYEEERVLWLPIAPISVNRVGWEAVVRQRDATSKDSDSVRVYKLEAAGEGREYLEAYLITEDGAEPQGVVLELQERL